jgi:hypothetical protein
VPCLRAFRSSVPSNVPPAEHGKEDGARSSAVAHALGGARPAGLGDGPSGRGQFTRVILTGWVLTLALAALAALGPVRS